MVVCTSVTRAYPTARVPCTAHAPRWTLGSAREIMQLFSIGLTKLNPDGTPELDGNGQPIETYDNEDILAYSRIWTGFDRQPSRGNIECRGGQGCANFLDPITIKPTWRDTFPKTSLDGGFIGDRYPVCTDLPPRAFLRIGARYQYLGFSRHPTLQDDPTYYETWLGGTLELELNRTNSSLYRRCRYSRYSRYNVEYRYYRYYRTNSALYPTTPPPPRCPTHLIDPVRRAASALRANSSRARSAGCVSQQRPSRAGAPSLPK